MSHIFLSRLFFGINFLLYYYTRGSFWSGIPKLLVKTIPFIIIFIILYIFSATILSMSYLQLLNHFKYHIYNIHLISFYPPLNLLAQFPLQFLVTAYFLSFSDISIDIIKCIPTVGHHSFIVIQLHKLLIFAFLVFH